MCDISDDSRFVSLNAPQRVWSFSSIHGDLERLSCLHDAVYERFWPGDRIVYLGNYTGYGQHSAEVVDELLTFRRMILAHPGVRCDDFVYLRGRQEDLWQRLYQLQFSPNPVDTLLWILSNGVTETFYSYGICPNEGVIAAREGTMFLTRWLARVREAVRANPGHEIFSTQFKRAAYTQRDGRYPLLFVNAGIDPGRDLQNQNDMFWWGGDDFTSMSDPYDPFEKVVRGFDPKHEGITVNCVSASIDGGCGFGGTLVCAGLADNGEFFELLEA